MPHGTPVCAYAQRTGESPATQGPWQQAEAGQNGRGSNDVPTKRGEKVEKLERFKRGIAAMTCDERAALEVALHAAVALQDPLEREELIDCITDIGAARGRAVSRRASDAATDFRRRSLVGARMAREQVERCQRCAQAEGVSLYRFVVSALEAACQRIEQAFDRTETAKET